MSATVQVFEPVASQSDARQTRRAIDTLSGKVIGFIDNAKPNFNYLVDDLAQLLVSKYGAAEVIKRRKIRAGIPVPAPMLQELTQECDAVITGSGD